MIFRNKMNWFFHYWDFLLSSVFSVIVSRNRLISPRNEISCKQPQRFLISWPKQVRPVDGAETETLFKNVGTWFSIRLYEELEKVKNSEIFWISDLSIFLFIVKKHYYVKHMVLNAFLFLQRKILSFYQPIEIQDLWSLKILIIKHNGLKSIELWNCCNFKENKKDSPQHVSWALFVNEFYCFFYDFRKLFRFVKKKKSCFACH